MWQKPPAALQHVRVLAVFVFVAPLTFWKVVFANLMQILCSRGSVGCQTAAFVLKEGTGEDLNVGNIAIPGENIRHEASMQRVEY
jgi:hypothetical protein